MSEKHEATESHENPLSGFAISMAGPTPKFCYHCIHNVGRNRLNIYYVSYRE